MSTYSIGHLQEHIREEVFNEHIAVLIKLLSLMLHSWNYPVTNSDASITAHNCYGRAANGQENLSFCFALEGLAHAGDGSASGRRASRLRGVNRYETGISEFRNQVRPALGSADHRLRRIRPAAGV